MNSLSTFPERPAEPGHPWPLGVSVDADGVNVAVHSASAEKIDFCIFDEDDTETRYPLVFRSGDIWHRHIPGISAGTRYGLRATGPFDPDRGLYFNSAKLLIDPHARALDGPLRWNELMNPRDQDGAFDDRDSSTVVPRCIVTADEFDWGNDVSPHTDWDRTVIYEAHVKGLTVQHPDIDPAIRGTYLALGSEPVIHHLQELGVTAIELLPTQAFIDDRFLVEQDLTNYWGYQPIAFGAPEPRYAITDPVTEFKQAVKSLHAAGIEVLLDVVFNHTGEGNQLGPSLSLRGLDNPAYYRLGQDRSAYVDDTGTGNTVQAAHPATLRLILDSLRYWVTEMHVDGFRFDLASTLGREDHGFDPAGRFFAALTQDPVLSRVKLIAEPWDIGPGGYQVGEFPPPFAEWNDRYRDGIRQVWRGDSFADADFGSRLLGSAGLFSAPGRDTTRSINFITAHDGFSLRDVVSYREKHNEANGEENADGHGVNYSDNLGAEGPTDDSEINAARAARQRGLLATLLLSQGVPMLLAGDEFGNSQSGNNNAYAQDNEISWLDWEQRDTELEELTRQLIAVRAAEPLLRQRPFLHGHVRPDGQQDIEWRRADGLAPDDDNWHDPQWRLVAAVIRGSADDAVLAESTDCLFLIVNTGDDAAQVQLPAEQSWQVLVDTAHGDATGDAHQDSYQAAAQSVVLLKLTD